MRWLNTSFNALMARFRSHGGDMATLPEIDRDDPQQSLTDDQLFERVFWRICEEDFLQHREAFSKLFQPGLNVVNGQPIRHFDRLCSWFFSENKVDWPRYDAYLAYWNEADPRIEPDDDEDVPDDYAMPPGKLLAHRIVMAFYAERRQIKHLENIGDRPVWRLSVLEDGRSYPECVNESQVAQRFDSDYWKHKRLPCDRLYCRCQVNALTEKEYLLLRRP